MGQAAEVSAFLFIDSPIAIVGVDGEFSAWNPAWQATFGEPKKTIFDHLHLDDAQFLKSQISQVTRSLHVRPLELRFSTEDDLYSSYRVQLEWEKTNNLCFIFCQHIGRLKDIEIEITKLWQRIDLAYVQIGLGYWRYDVGSGKIDLDPHVIDLYEVSSEDQASSLNFLAKIIHPEDFDRLKKEITEAIKNESEFNTEFRTINAEGEIRVKKVSANIIRDANGLAIELLGINWDVTELKEQQARSQAAAKMASLGEMASGIAHEINNPLSVIHGRATLLKEMAIKGKPVASEILIDYATKIQTTAGRIAKIVKGLKLFARNDVLDQKQRVSLKAIIDDSFELCQERLRKRDIGLRISDIPDVELNCHAAQISQVLLNLLSNSIDAIENQKSPWIALEFHPTRDFTMAIRILDSGDPIPESTAEKLMQPFFTTKDVGKGTGLGLSIAKGIAENHGGRLWLDRSHKNTCFVFEIPFQQKFTQAKVA